MTKEKNSNCSDTFSTIFVTISMATGFCLRNFMPYPVGLILGSSGFAYLWAKDKLGFDPLASMIDGFWKQSNQATQAEADVKTTSHQHSL
jgi:hypothetical protein